MSRVKLQNYRFFWGYFARRAELNMKSIGNLIPRAQKMAEMSWVSRGYGRILNKGGSQPCRLHGLYLDNPLFRLSIERV